MVSLYKYILQYNHYTTVYGKSNLYVEIYIFHEENSQGKIGKKTALQHVYSIIANEKWNLKQTYS